MTAFGGFGVSATKSQAFDGNTFGSSVFGSTSLFGSKPTTTSAFGFSAPAQPAFGGLGTGAKPSTAGGTFSFGTGNTGFGGYGATTTSSSLNFGSAFGSTANTGFPGGTGGLSFGGLKPSSSTSLFGVTAQPEAQPGAMTGGLGGSLTANGPKDASQQNLTALVTAMTVPLLFNDERDALVARWNQLQAFWGTGKAYYTQSGAAVDIAKDNPFSRFQAVGYSKLPTTRNEDGLVGLQIAAKESDVRAQHSALVQKLAGIFGMQPTLTACVETLQSLGENMTEMVIYVLERGSSGSTRRVPALELYRVLRQPAATSQLQQMYVNGIVPKVEMSSEKIKLYLTTPPAGIDISVWQQACKDNPDPNTLIPVPLSGFQETKQRLLLQKEASEMHLARLKIIRESLKLIEQDGAKQVSLLEEFKRKCYEQSHVLLKVMCRQEVIRKLGQGAYAEEEHLRIALDKLNLQLTSPLEFKSRLAELLSLVRLRRGDVARTGNIGESDERSVIAPELLSDICKHLSQEQEGFNHLVSILQSDSEDLQYLAARFDKYDRKKSPYG